MSQAHVFRAWVFFCLKNPPRWQQMNLDHIINMAMYKKKYIH